MSAFPGLPEDLFKFLRQLAKNNNREWFKANKERYHKVVADPVCDFIEAIAPKLEVISSHYIADSRTHGGSMFRIYRDIRYSKDKKPYKEHVGCQFRHEAGKDAHAPGFYLHIAPNEILFGGGVWMPPNPVLAKIRDAIVEQPDQWQKVTQGKAFLKRFGALKGDGLIRPPRGYEPDHQHIEDLKRKTLFVMREATPELAMSPKFITEVNATFKAASPFMEFLTKSIELPY